MSTGWEGHPVHEAIAEQEEYLKRIHSCQNRLGMAHSWETFSSAPGGPTYQACWRCRVTKTPEDYATRLFGTGLVK